MARWPALLVLSLVLWPRASHAQACCAGASAVTPGRLEMHEKVLVGWSSRVGAMVGSFDSHGRAHAKANGASEWDFEHSFFAAARWLKRGQGGVLVPIVHSLRSSATTSSEHGAGPGDINLFARYDLLYSRERRYFPGVAVLAGVTFPTGRAPESARLPLGSDATGIGTTQLNVGFALERTFGPMWFNWLGLAAERFDREVHGVESSLATLWSSTFAFGAHFGSNTAVGLVTTFSYEGDASLDRRDVPNSGRRGLRTALAGSVSISDDFRIQSNLFVDPPISGLGQNQITSAGMTVVLVRSIL